MPQVTVLKGSEITDFEDDRGNKVIGTARVQPETTVRFAGSNCSLILGENTALRGGIHFRNSDATVKIGDRTVINANFDVGEKSSILFGKRIMVTGRMVIVTYDGCTVSIGDDCLFSQEIALRAWDNHPIYDLRTRARTNYARDITIESDVWIGNGVNMSGGAFVEHGSIVGTRAVVTASSVIGEHELAVGQPARSVRKFVAWAKPGNPPAPTMAEGAHASCLKRLEAKEQEINTSLEGTDLPR